MRYGSFLTCSMGLWLLLTPAASATGPTIVSTLPEDVAPSIFVGVDADMPVSTQWILSINPTMVEDRPYIPHDAESALAELKRALPRWYVNHLKISKGHHECFVEVNGRYVTFALLAWIEVNWGLGDSSSPLHAVLQAYGAKSPPEMAQLLHGGLCQYLKSDVQGALRAMETYRDP